MSGESELRIASLISGGASTMEQIAIASQEGCLAGKVKLVAVFADRMTARIDKATRRGVVGFMIDKKHFGSSMEWGEEIVKVCRDLGVDVILQNGRLSLTPANVIEEYQGMIFNQHPAGLDPDHKDEDGNSLDFGGNGMHGPAAHAAVLKFQESTGRNFPTEATIHHVTAKYDEGQVVYRTGVPVCEGDTPETLAKRVLLVEHQGQINFLNALYEGKVEILKRNEVLIRDGEQGKLYEAKEYGIGKYNKKK